MRVIGFTAWGRGICTAPDTLAGMSSIFRMTWDVDGDDDVVRTVAVVAQLLSPPPLPLASAQARVGKLLQLGRGGWLSQGFKNA